MSFSSDPALLINQLPISIEVPVEENRQRETIELYLKRIANILNTKSGGLFSQQEFSNSELYQLVNPTSSSNVYRKCFNMVQLNGVNIPANGTVSFPHNISGLLSATLIYAGCTNTQPIYFSEMGPTNVWLDANNVNFTNQTAFPLTACFIVAEYIKN